MSFQCRYSKSIEVLIPDLSLKERQEGNLQAFAPCINKKENMQNKDEAEKHGFCKIKIKK